MPQNLHVVGWWLAWIEIPEISSFKYTRSRLKYGTARQLRFNSPQRDRFHTDVVVIIFSNSNFSAIQVGLFSSAIFVFFPSLGLLLANFAHLATRTKTWDDLLGLISTISKVFFFYWGGNLNLADETTLARKTLFLCYVFVFNYRDDPLLGAHLLFGWGFLSTPAHHTHTHTHNHTPCNASDRTSKLFTRLTNLPIFRKRKKKQRPVRKTAPPQHDLPRVARKNFL